MNQLLIMFIILSLITSFGTSIVNMLNFKQINSLEKIALGFLFGNGIFTYILFLLNRLGFAYSFSNFIVVLLILNGISWIITPLFHKPEIDSSSEKTHKQSIAERIYNLAILIIASSTLVAGLVTPARDWDSLVLYDFRAKTFVATGYMDEGIARGYFFGYPLLSSLSHTWVYLSGWQYPTFIHALYYISLFLVVGYLAKLLLHNVFLQKLSLLVVALSPALLSHAFMTYTNLMYCSYIILGFLFLLVWDNKNQLNYFIASLIMVWLSSWTRINEPFWLVAVVTATIIALRHRKWLLGPIYYFVIILLQQPWTSFEQQYLTDRVSVSVAAPSYLKIILQNLNFTKIADVSIYLFDNIVRPEKSIYMLLFLCIVLFIYHIFMKKISFHDVLYPVFILLCMAMIGAGTYIFSIIVPSWREIGNSASRMTMFLGPLTTLWGIALLDQYLHAKKNGK